MMGPSARLLAIGPLLALVACGGCAERRDGAWRAPEPATAATPFPVALPTAEPIPADLACAADGECTVSPFSRPVAAAADCYCPTCPQPLAAGAGAARAAAWERFCGSAYAARARCQAPMCSRLPSVACRDGACRPVGPGD